VCREFQNKYGRPSVLRVCLRRMGVSLEGVRGGERLCSGGRGMTKWIKGIKKITHHTDLLDHLRAQTHLSIYRLLYS
jgi:hypothetical protein